MEPGEMVYPHLNRKEGADLSTFSGHIYVILGLSL